MVAKIKIQSIYNKFKKIFEYIGFSSYWIYLLLLTSADKSQNENLDYLFKVNIICCFVKLSENNKKKIILGLHMFEGSRLFIIKLKV